MNDTTPVARTAPVLRCILPEMLPGVLPLIAEKLIAVAERSRGEFDAAQMVHRFQTGTWQLWVVWDGELRAVIATELHLGDSGLKQCTIRVCAGTGVDDWLHLIRDLEQWAAMQGCTRMNMVARKGWAKKYPDYEMTHVMLEKEIA